MNEITITFVQEETGKSITLKVEVSMTAAEAINALVEDGFLAPQSMDAPYGFREKPDGVDFSGAQTFEQAGVRDGSTVLITAIAGPGCM